MRVLLKTWIFFGRKGNGIFYLQAKEILSCAADHAASVHTPPVHTTAHLNDPFSHIYCATYSSFLCHPNLRFNVSRQNQIMRFFGTGAWVTSLELHRFMQILTKLKISLVYLHKLFSSTEREIYWIVEERGKEEKYPRFSIIPFLFLVGMWMKWYLGGNKPKKVEETTKLLSVSKKLITGRCSAHRLQQFCTHF